MTYARDVRVQELAVAFGTDQGEQNAAILAVDGKATSVQRVTGLTPQEYGAGTTDDDTLAFSLAAKSAPALVNISGALGSVPFPRADMCVVRVPDGEYRITELLDVGNRDVTWVLGRAAVIDGLNFLNGTVVREGQRTTRARPNGTLDYAAGQSFIVGGDEFDRNAGITGVYTVQQLADYPNRDKVALFASARPNAPLVDAATATYTATTVTSDPLTQDQLRQLKKGMVVDTKHDPRWSGFLTDWNEDGSVLTVGSWAVKGGSAAGTPPNGTGFRVNAFTKLWAANFTAHLTPDGSEDALIGTEYSIYNTRRDFNDPNLEAAGNSFWGELMSLAGGGSYKMGAAGYVVSGPWKYGYAVRGVTGVETGFYFENSTNDGIGFKYKGGGQAVLVQNNSRHDTFTVAANGNLQIGPAETASSLKLIDFRTSGLANAYDVRLEASGGEAGNVGQGTFRILALITRFMGSIYPTVDAVRDCGTSAFRWANLFASRLRPGNGSVIWTAGAGTPEGVLTAPIGSFYTRTDGGTGTTLYVKETGGTSNTGWVAK